MSRKHNERNKSMAPSEIDHPTHLVRLKRQEVKTCQETQQHLSFLEGSEKRNNEINKKQFYSTVNLETVSPQCISPFTGLCGRFNSSKLTCLLE